MPSPERPAVPISLFYSYSHKDEALQGEARDPPEPVAGPRGSSATGTTAASKPARSGTGPSARTSRTPGSSCCWSVPTSSPRGTAGTSRSSRAMERHEAGTARVIPVILRPVDWHTAPFGKLQALPKDVRPVTTWKNRDEAFTDVARGIREAAMSLAAGTQNSSAPARSSAVVLTKASERPRARGATSGPGPKHQTGAAREEVPDLDRGALVTFLSRLAPSSWATYLASIPEAAVPVSHNLPIPEQVGQLVRWAESPEGPTLELLWLTAKKLFPNFL